MKIDNGSRKQKLYLRTAEILLAGLFMIRRCHPMIRRIKIELLSIGFLYWTNPANRKLGFGKGKEQNISGRKSISRPMTGMTGRTQNNGEHHGQITVTGIWIMKSRSITVLLRGRAWTRSQQFMRDIQPEAWRVKAGKQIAVRSTGRSDSGIHSGIRSKRWL